MFDHYILEKGDSIDKISQMFNITKEEIMKINNIVDEREFKEQREIKLPILATPYYNTYTIEKGDSLYAIARKYNINPELLASMNGLSMEDYIYPNQELIIPKNNYSYYITKEGDTLNTVSQMFKTNVNNLLKDNQTIYLSEGQILVHQK